MPIVVLELDISDTVYIQHDLRGDSAFFCITAFLHACEQMEGDCEKLVHKMIFLFQPFCLGHCQQEPLLHLTLNSILSVICPHIRNDTSENQTRLWRMTRIKLEKATGSLFWGGICQSV